MMNDDKVNFDGRSKLVMKLFASIYMFRFNLKFCAQMHILFFIDKLRI